MVTIEWQDAPAFYMEECVGKKDTFDNKAFLEMFKVVHIEACGIRGRESRDVASSSTTRSMQQQPLSVVYDSVAAWQSD